MIEKVDSITKEILEKIKISDYDTERINRYLKDFLKKVKKEIKDSKISADVFIGGSFAKGTIINKIPYDIDIFIRFDWYKNSEISKRTEQILKKVNFGKIIKIHGSRDYFRIKISEKILFEIIPVRKIKSPKKTEDITDLSYFHVKYIKNRIKSKKIFDEIKIAKAFCYVNGYYGAESYINGFSGYGLELLIYHYKTFKNFIKNIARHKNGKIVIDIEKHYKKKNNIFIDINAAKIQSPIILIDPTYKQRNVLAALSQETFDNFKKTCKKFLKKPSIKAFEHKKIDFKKIRENSVKKDYNFVLIKVETNRQEGDIAGSKLFKFYNYMKNEIRNFFYIKKSGFKYSGKKTATYFFVTGDSREILVQGPKLNQKEHVKKFKNKHKKVFLKNNRVYIRYKINKTLIQFIEDWKKKNTKKIREMKIIKMNVMD